MHAVLEDDHPDQVLSKACKQLSTEFPDLFKPEFSCLKDHELEVAYLARCKVSFLSTVDSSICYSGGLQCCIQHWHQERCLGAHVV